mmetsp:Transcript_6380/g.18072  ORF Transcript_6380/g.18072 Transcript_6380/m.18072 type:complete len:270 (-) Transcript_6380:592-1401(-)
MLNEQGVYKVHFVQRDVDNGLVRAPQRNILVQVQMLPKVRNVGEFFQKRVDPLLVTIQHGIQGCHEELLHPAELDVICQILQDLGQECQISAGVGRELGLHQHESLGRDDGRIDKTKKVESTDEGAHLLPCRVREPFRSQQANLAANPADAIGHRVERRNEGRKELVRDFPQLNDPRFDNVLYVRHLRRLLRSRLAIDILDHSGFRLSLVNHGFKNLERVDFQYEVGVGRNASENAGEGSLEVLLPRSTPGVGGHHASEGRVGPEKIAR